MKNSLTYILAMLLVMGCLASCDTIHEFPEEERMDVEFVVIPEAEDITHEIKNGVVLSDSFPQVFPENVNRRLVCEFRSLVTDRVVKTEVFALGNADPESEYRFRSSLPLDEYRVAAWYDYANHATPPVGKYWDTAADLRNVMLSDLQAGDTDEMDCRCGHVDVDLTPYRGKTSQDLTVEIPVHRPVGKFVLVANDVPKQVLNLTQRATRTQAKALEELSRYTAKVYLQGYTLCGYNAAEDLPNDAMQGMSFTGKFRLLNDSEAQMAFSYNLAHPDGTTLHLAIQICDEQGETVNEVPSLDVVIRQGMLTVVRFDFLTHYYHNGITIDQGFDGEFDIRLPD